MACPGCNYNCNSSSCPTASYTPSSGNHSHSPVSYSHNVFFSPEHSLGSASYNALTSYNNNDGSPSYAALPSQVNYQISNILKDLVIKKEELEEEPETKTSVRDLVPVQQFEIAAPSSEKENAIAQAEILEALHRSLLNNSFNGAVRLTQIEEETIIVQRKRIRVTDIIPTEHKMRNVTESNDNE
jgi:hypothetical protein